MTIEELINNIKNGNILLSSVLLDAKIIGVELKDDKFVSWVNKELNGYEEKKEIPEYRTVKGEVKGLNPYRGWMPIIHKHPETQELVSERKIIQPIGQLEEFLKKDRDGNNAKSFMVKYPPIIEANLRRAIDCDTEIALFIDRSQITSILDKIRNKTLDWALESKKPLDGKQFFDNKSTKKESKKFWGYSLFETAVNDLKIIEATYYVPEIGVGQGIDVTAELSAQIVDGKLFYSGIYNNIFIDRFIGKHKRLKIDIEYRGRMFTKFYNEDEKINLPNDLGENKKEKWWERNWVQIIIFLGSLAGIVTIIWAILKK